jgi:hypothetical protein
MKKHGHATFGEPKEAIAKDSKEFLKKRSRRKDLPPRPRAGIQVNPPLEKPPVPRQREIPASPQHVQKDLLTDNWKSASKTKVLHQDKPQTWYMEKPDFGKSPRYLKKVTEEAHNEAPYWDQVRESMMPEDTETRCRLLSQEERAKILDGLQLNLADNKKRYAALSFGQDHMSFRKRKEGMEQQAAQLEADMATMSRQNVYVT